MFAVHDAWDTSVLSYSYSNLTDGRYTLSDGGDIVAAVNESMGAWTAVSPLVLFWQQDSGPLPTTSESTYDRDRHPAIRWGYHAIDDDRV